MPEGSVELKMPGPSSCSKKCKLEEATSEEAKAAAQGGTDLAEHERKSGETSEDEHDQVAAAIEKAKRQVIRLDCAPGMPRPNELLPLALQKTGLPVVEASSKLFGDFSFDYSHIEAAVWCQALPKLEANIKLLFAKQMIRFGSWEE
jgi:hypothetical protein